MSEIQRREFLARTAKSCFGVSLGSTAASWFIPSVQAEVRKAKAKSVIFLFMKGGLSQLDTFDPKENRSVMGATELLSTNVPGIQLGSTLPKLSKMADQFSLIRSMATTQGAHKQGVYFARTGYRERSTITHPSLGGWVEALSGSKKKGDLPSFVTIGQSGPGAGFLPTNFKPLPIGSAEAGLQNSRRDYRTSEEDFQEQIQIQKQLNESFNKRFFKGHKSVRSYEEAYNSALSLMKSKDLEAFDLSKESKEAHKLYGVGSFAKGCLLARRLVEYGVRSIEVTMGGFDWHQDNFKNGEVVLPQLDQALSALLIDLKLKGLLESTLIVLTTEFGRTPDLNRSLGRDHYPKAFSALMAGAGIKGGFVYGDTGKDGRKTPRNRVTAGSLNATVGHVMGLDIDRVIYSESKRPFKMGSKNGKVLKDILS